MHRSIVLIVATLTSAFFFSAVPTRATEDPLVVGDIDKAPAPPWLKPGMRLTYFAGSGTIQRGGRQTTPANPGDPGAFWDDDYQQWVVLGTPEAGAGTSLQESQVVAIDRGKVCITNRSFIANHDVNITGAILPDANQTVRILPVGDAGDLWKSPALLQAQAELRSPNFWRIKAVSIVNGKQVRVIMMQGKNMSWQFDQDTGILLSCSGIVRTPNSGIQGDESVSMAVTKFLNLRETKYPWIGMPAPDWIKTMQSFSAKVQRTTINSNAIQAGLQPRVETYEFTATVVDRGSDWTSTVVMDSRPAPDGKPRALPNSLVVTGPGCDPGAIWLPPAGLANLKAGQLIDSDPVTNIVTTVSRVAPGPDDNEIVVLTEAAPGFQFDFGYDRKSGKLIFAEKDFFRNRFETEKIKVAVTAIR